MTVDPKVLSAERGDEYGPIRFITMAEGYVMVRRPGAMPWCESVKKWLARPLETTAGPARTSYRKALEASK